MRTEQSLRNSITFAAALLYFSQGFPYGIVTELLNLYLRTKGVGLAEIGFLSTVGLAWTIKLAWAPLVDAFGSYRQWILAALTFIFAVLAFFAVTGAARGPMFWIAVSILALASATQDIAIDAFTILISPRDMLGTVNSTRVTAYRVAIIVAGGGLAGLASLWSWRAAFAAAAGISALILAGCFFLPAQRLERAPVRRETVRFTASIRSWLLRRRAIVLLAVVFLFRLGDAALAPMIKPFWVDRGYSAAEIGTVTTVAGISFTILGAIAGGAVINRSGIYPGLLWFGLVQMLSNGGYAAVASFGGGRAAIYAAAIVESFTGGLGTAAFLAFMMSLCDRDTAATEYALLTAVYILSRTLAGSISGIGAEALGYPLYFWITVALGVPGLLLLPFIRGAVAEAEESAA
ncbi:MAG: MFS transporter [Acidobacteriota bacterium]